MYYAHINTEYNSISKGQCPCSGEGIECIEVSQEVYDNIEKYIYQDGEIVLNPDYDKEQLEKAKQDKLNEALTKANEFINNTATYRDIECTDGNISKLTAYLIAIQQGLYTTVIWVTKSDETVVLTLDDITDILENIGKIQTDVWSNQYITYKQDIESATTIEEVKAIEIEYTSNI